MTTSAPASMASLDSVGDTAPTPDVVVLEHDHGAEIHPVSVRAANQHAVLFNQAKTRRRLSRPCNHTRIPSIARNRHKPLTLGSDTRASCQGVQRNALTEENTTHRPLDRCDPMLPVAQINSVSLVGVPLDGAAALRKDLVEEGSAGNDTCGLTPECSDAGTITDDETGVVKRGCVFSKPSSYRSFPRGREEVCEVSGRLVHFREGNDSN
ncbi:hypothetical protein HG530_015367 [Fusarium avenaceum]|nr:hypothetical protein HG530_015367 [Fusarium avenaceum]